MADVRGKDANDDGLGEGNGGPVCGPVQSFEPLWLVRGADAFDAGHQIRQVKPRALVGVRVRENGRLRQE